MKQVTGSNFCLARRHFGKLSRQPSSKSGKDKAAKGEECLCLSYAVPLLSLWPQGYGKTLLLWINTVTIN